MPFQYASDDTIRRIRVTLTDPLTVADRIAPVERQLAEDAWGYGMIIDARSLLAFTPSATEMQTVAARVAELVAEHGPRGPVAIVSNRAAVITAAHRYNYISSKRDTVEVFWDLDEAQKFLNRQPAKD